MSGAPIDEHPARPPSAIVRAAQARLLDRLDALALAEPSEDAPIAPGGADEGSDEQRYEFGELLATGGLGLVRRAFDRRLGRTVAVKELQRSDPAAERRFRFEAAITAHLQHPGIVPIYDTGRFPNGEPYYCMKLVDGESLEQIVAARETTLLRLGLLEHVLAAADAVAYAHVHGVIHRDLKPANILVGAHGETLVIDWGLAKDLAGGIVETAGPASEHDAASTLTDVGAIVGTLRYMPPEQARGETVDRRSDVFALGAVLFHVIAGRPPHEGLGRAELLARLSDGEAPDLRPLADGVPRALVAIVRKAMAPDPADRYADAGAFADDLRRFLSGRLVDAHRYQTGELLRAWMRRHRAVLAVAGVATLALLIASVLFLRNLGVEHELATAARHRAEIAESEALRRADAAVLAQARGTLAEDLVAALTLLGQVDLSDDAWRRSAHLTALAAQARGAPDRVLRGHTRSIEHIAALSDGKLVSIDGGGEVRRWDPRTGEGEIVVDIGAPRGRLVAAAEAPVWVAMAADRGYVVRGDEAPELIDIGELYVGSSEYFATHRWELSRHGEMLAALTLKIYTGQRRATAYTWDLQARPAVAGRLPFEYLHNAALSPDGSMIATSDGERRTWLINGDTATAVPSLKFPQKFSPSGRYLIGTSTASPPATIALSLSDRSIQVIDGGVVAVTAEDNVLVDARDPAGGTTFILPNRLSLRSIATGETRWTAALEITKEVMQAIWGRQGCFVIADRGDRFALQLGDQWQIWSMATGKIERTLDTGPHHWAAFLPDGSFAVAHFTDLWLWSPLPPPASKFSVYALASDGSHAVGHSGRYIPQLLRLSDNSTAPIPCIELRRHELYRVVGRVAVDVRGRVLFIDEAGKVCLSDERGEAHPISVPTWATATALSDTGESFAVGLRDGAVLAWNTISGSPRRWQLDAGIRQLWILGDGLALIAQTGSGAVVALRPDDDAPTPLGSSVPDRDLYGVRVVMHPQQRTAAVLLGDEGAVVFYDLDGPEIRRPTSFSIEAAAAYSPSGRRFAVGLAGRVLLVLESPDDPGREFALPEEARGLAFIDEDALVVVGESGALLRVDLLIGEAALIHHDWKHTMAPTLVTAAPSGQAIVTSNTGLHVQPADPVPGDSSGLAAWLSQRTR